MTTSWWEVQVLGSPALEEGIFWRFDSFGSQGTASQMRGTACLVKTYFPQHRMELLDLSALALLVKQDALGYDLPPPQVWWTLIDEEDWSKSWKQHWQPEPIGDRLLVTPAWLDPPADNQRLVLRLDPGIAFGTGAHPTTQLCLESLEMRLASTPETITVADIGCGSGILSIAAILLGARRAYAADIDDMAVSSALANRDLNQISAGQLAIVHGSLEALKETLEGPVEGILCNILAEVIIDLVPQLSPLVTPQSWGIFSGILLSQSKLVAETLEQHGWIVATLWRREQWCCLNVRRSQT